MSKIIITDSFFGLDFPKKCQITITPISFGSGKSLLKMLRPKVQTIGRCFYKNIFDAASRSGIHPLEYRADGFPNVKVFYGDLVLLLEVDNKNSLVFRAVYIRQAVISYAPVGSIELEIKKKKAKKYAR